MSCQCGREVTSLTAVGNINASTTKQTVQRKKSGQQESKCISVNTIHMILPSCERQEAYRQPLEMYLIKSCNHMETVITEPI